MLNLEIIFGCTAIGTLAGVAAGCALVYPTWIGAATGASVGSLLCTSSIVYERQCKKHIPTNPDPVLVTTLTGGSKRNLDPKASQNPVFNLSIS